MKLIIYSSIYFISLQAHVRICYGIEIECQFYNEFIMIKKQILFKDYIKMPWKNGQGTTFEVEIYPQDSSLSQLNFDYRISMALVSSDNEFSAFLGMKRILTVIDGSGIWFNEKVINPLDIVEFDGEEKILSGPIVSGETNLDLGIIYNPRIVTCKMELLKHEKTVNLKIKSHRNYFFKIEDNKKSDCVYIQKEFAETELSVEFESGTWISINIDYYAKLPS